MGGIGSGRPRTRNVGNVDDAIALDIRFLRRSGQLEFGERRSKLWTWSVQDGKFRCAVIVDLTDPMCGLLTLNYRYGGRWHFPEIPITWIDCRYGGKRFYFIEPFYQNRVERLFLMRDGQFYGREFARLSYVSQNQTEEDRKILRRDRVKARLDGAGRHPKPRGRHRRELHRQWVDLECEVEEAFERRIAGYWAILEALERR